MKKSSKIDLIDKLNKVIDDLDSEIMTVKYDKSEEASFLLSDTSPSRRLSI